MMNSNWHPVDVNESLVISEAVDVMIILWQDGVKELKVGLFEFEEDLGSYETI